MALPRSLVQIDFGQGFDTKIDPKQLPPGKLADLVNMRIDKSKAITKRVGTELVAAGGGSLTSAWVQGDDVIANYYGTGGKSQRLSAGGFRNAGPNPLASQVEIQRIAKDAGASAKRPDCAVANGYSLVGWYDAAGNVSLQPFDADNRAYADPTVYAVVAPNGPRMASYPGTAQATDGRMYALFGTNAAQADFVYWDSTTKAYSSILALAALNTVSMYDVAPYETASARAMFCALRTAAGQITLYKVNTTAMTQTNVSFATVGNPTELAVAVDSASGHVYVFWVEGATPTVVHCTVYNATTLAVVTAPAVVLTLTTADVASVSAVCATAGQVRMVVHSSQNPTPLQAAQISVVDVPSTLVVVSTPSLLYGYSLISKPYYDSVVGDVAMVVAWYTGAQRFCAWAYCYPSGSFTLIPRAKFLTNEIASSNGKPKNVGVSSSGVYRVAVAAVSRIAEITGMGINSIDGVAVATLTSRCTPNVRVKGRIGEVSGGAIFTHDGTSFVEHGFFADPVIASVTTSTLGGSMASGTYLYVGLWEWYDARGNLHRGPPSLTVTATIGGAVTTGSVALQVCGLGLTMRSLRTAPSFVFYRIQLGGTTFYRVNSPATPFVPLLNPTVAGLSSYTDTAADATIASNEVYPYSGGVVPASTPNGSDVLAIGDERMWIADPADDGAVVYSNRFLPGELPMFTASNVKRVPDEGGGVKAIAVMDGRKVVFKRRAAFWFSGDGPNDLGGGGGFSETLTASPVAGCESQRAVAEIPQGLVFFANGLGFSLLTRSMQVVPLAEADDYKDGNVLDMLAVPEANELRISMDGLLLADGTTACTLVYNWAENAWSQFTDGAFQYAPAQMFIGDDDVVHMLLYSVSARELYRENPDAYTDAHRAAAAYRPLFSTGWLTPGQLGYWRVYRLLLLGDQVDAATQQLSVAIQYDYSDATSETRTITTANAKIGSSSYNFEVQPSRQKCQAIKFTIFETVAVSNSLRFTAMALEVGVKPTGARHRAEKRATT